MIVETNVETNDVLHLKIYKIIHNNWKFKLNFKDLWWIVGWNSVVLHL